MQLHAPLPRSPVRPSPAVHALPAWLRALRPGFLLLTAIACSVGIATSRADGIALAPSLVFATLLLGVLAHAAANVWNDCGDAVIGTDAINADRIEPFTGGSRVIQNGELSLARMRALAAALAALTLAGGLALSWLRGPGLLGIGCAGALLGWAYSQPTLALMSRGAGELAVGLSWGLVVVGADFVQRGGFDRLPVAASLSLAALVAAVLLINQIPDIGADGACGKRTLAVRIGPTRAALVYGVLVLAAYGWIVLGVVAGRLPGGAAAGLVTLPLGVAATRRALRHAADPDTPLLPALQMSVMQALGHGILLTAGIGLHGH